MNLKRFWFEFTIVNVCNYPAGVGYGCGVTAYDLDDAMKILNKLFKNDKIPSIKKVIENVDLQTLDQHHVIPNMNPPIDRGIWFPQGDF
jgi:hypothetical protein